MFIGTTANLTRWTFSNTDKMCRKRFGLEFWLRSLP
jgi:hypothetical protein